MISRDGCTSDHYLVLFVLGMVKDESELASLEQHLLACAECIDRADETFRFVGTIKPPFPF